jgi:predicted transposase YbfD/YdcC
LAQVCRLERTTKHRGKTTHEVQYAVTSVPRPRAAAAQLSHAWRGHWGIENRLHWVRDVAFGEDQCQVRCGPAPQILAAFRNATVGLLRRTGHHEITATLRGFAYQPRKLLQFMGIVKQ